VGTAEEREGDAGAGDRRHPGPERGVHRKGERQDGPSRRGGDGEGGRGPPPRDAPGSAVWARRKTDGRQRGRERPSPWVGDEGEEVAQRAAARRWRRAVHLHVAARLRPDRLERQDQREPRKTGDREA
jgi:hypothetical protein